MTNLDPKELERAMNDGLSGEHEVWDSFRALLESVSPEVALTRKTVEKCLHALEALEVPDGSKRRVVEYLVARIRAERRKQEAVFRDLAAFAKMHVREFVYGCASQHGPRHGTWRADAERARNELYETPFADSKPNVSAPSARSTRERAKVEMARKIVLERTQGSSAIIVGGHHRNSARRRLKQYFAFEELSWLNPKKHKTLRKFGTRIRNGNIEVVVVLKQLSSHYAVDFFKDAVADTDALYISLTAGYGATQIEEGIASLIEIK